MALFEWNTATFLTCFFQLPQKCPDRIRNCIRPDPWFIGSWIRARNLGLRIRWYGWERNIHGSLTLIGSVRIWNATIVTYADPYSHGFTVHGFGRVYKAEDWSRIMSSAIVSTNVEDPYVSGLPGSASGSVCHKYGSGPSSGSFYHLAKIGIKPWFLLLCDFCMAFYL
jgi:hypothetical protein